MTYYFNKQVAGDSLDILVQKVTDALKEESFGVLTQIDIRETLKKKIDVDFRPYVILGACNPPYAYKALQSEAYIGLMLPCNVVVQQSEEDGFFDVSAIDPVESMRAVENAALEPIAREIRARLKRVIEGLN